MPGVVLIALSAWVWVWVDRYVCTGALTIEQMGHFGLGLHFYTHFTSSIRRYADVVVRCCCNHLSAVFVVVAFVFVPSSLITPHTMIAHSVFSFSPLQYNTRQYKTIQCTALRCQKYCYHCRTFLNRFFAGGHTGLVDRRVQVIPDQTQLEQRVLSL